MLNQYSPQSNNESYYSIRQIYYILKKYRKVNIIAFFAVLFVCIYVTLISKPIYKASSTIMISQDQKSISMLDMGLGKDRNYIENEIEVLKSLTISKLVIEQLINGAYKDNLYILGTNKTKTSLLGKMMDFMGLVEAEKKATIEFNDILINNATNLLRNSIQISNKRNTDIITVSITSSMSLFIFKP